ncbi:MAG: cupin domain-containing protein [Spirosomataceae bacterium]
MERRTFLASAPTLLAIPSASAALVPMGVDKPFIVKKDEARFGKHTPYRGVHPNDIKISGKDTNGQLAVFEYIGLDKIGPSLHVHHDQDEIFSVIEGEFLFQVGDEKMVAKAGDTVFAPRQVPHSWIQTSEKSKLIYYVQPAGKMEEFFLKMSELQGPPSEELVQKIHKEHGMTVLGPPLKLN